MGSVPHHAQPVLRLEETDQRPAALGGRGMLTALAVAQDRVMATLWEVA